MDNMLPSKVAVRPEKGMHAHNHERVTLIKLGSPRMASGHIEFGPFTIYEMLLKHAAYIRDQHVTLPWAKKK